MRNRVTHWWQRYVNPTNLAATIVFTLTIILGICLKW